LKTTTTAAAVDERTDEDLMLDLRHGGDGGSRLFERYRDPVWRFFKRRVDRDGRAEELAQDVFIAVIEGAARYDPRAPFRSYLFGIAYNVLMADRRKARGAAATIDVDLPAAQSADPDDGMWVRAALARLDPADREVLMLREYEQLTYQEIADLQEVPLNTVRSRLFRARMALKDALVPQVAHKEQAR
jgi:RNA polymerase sigma-70 factor (ECF subfamily)